MLILYRQKYFLQGTAEKQRLFFRRQEKIFHFFQKTDARNAGKTK